MPIGYNSGVTVFGGFTPAIIIWLVNATGSKAAPSFYMMLTAAISLAAPMAVGRLPVAPRRAQMAV
jgi:MHS family proline/betaine transporter-like MFS transporter